ncbi:Transcription factor 25 [Termitomyces sp. J132]|nr:Transcription factor 25 [Termitomyces sp. J132]
MAPRLNKRQQRELEELSSLGAGVVSTSDAISDGEEVVTKSKPGVGFSSRFLMEDGVDDGGEESEQETVPVAAKRKKKKNKKKADTSASTHTPPPKNEKKAAKRAKAKEKKAGNDELEQALAELSLKYSTAASSMSTGLRTLLPTPNTLTNLLAVSLVHLDPTAEMRKFFGSKVVSSSTTSTSSGSSRTRRAAAIKQKSNLTRPQPGWWSANQREGLSIRSLDAAEVKELEGRRGWDTDDGKEDGGKGKGDERWWTVEYSQRYKSLTKLFIQAVMSGHPDALWEVQRKLPWHADNLLQLAEVYRHREEYAQAVDFVDRALFTYERALIGAFTFTTGTNRLDFDRVENRPFFLAIHRQISDLSRRGCTRTAFEFSRLLYGLDPHSDPHGAVFHLDLLAVKGGMGEWLVDLFEYHDQVREGKAKEMRKMDPSLLPGWAYARALVLRVAEGDKANDTSPSAKALEEAIRSFPEVVPLLADKLEVALPGYIRSHESFRVNTDAGTLPPSHAALHALAHMYTAHSSAPWKDPSYSFLPSWFLSLTTSLFPTPSSLPSSSSLPSTPRRTALLSLLSNMEVQRMLVRHVMVLEGTHRRLLSFLPKDILMGGQGGAGGAGLACDPVPPGTGVSRYDDVYFEGVEDAFAWSGRGRGRGGAVDEEDERMLEAVIRDREVRMRVLQFLRGLRMQFPGGLREMLERIGPEAVEDVLGQVQGLIVGDEEAGGMPGAFAAAAVDEGGGAAVEGQGERVPVVEPEPRREVVPTQEEEGDEDEDEDEDEHRDTSGIRRMFRSVLGRFWNGAVGIAGDTSSDEDEDDEEIAVGRGQGRQQGREEGEESDDVD